MATLFERAVERVLEREGGESNDPRDRGKHTNLGITAATLREALDSRLVSRGTTIPTLTREDAIVIYRALFWRRAGCERLPAPVAVVVFDFAVHSSPVRAVKLLQKVLRVDEDGVVGPETVAAARRAGSRTIEMLSAARLELMHDLFTADPEQLAFRRGWWSRVAAVAYWAGQLSMEVQ